MSRVVNKYFICS